MKIIGITVCVNYSDYLSKVIEHNKKIIDDLIVVTTTDDLETRQLCEKTNTVCLVSNSCYEEGHCFNKGKMVNVGLLHAYLNYRNEAYLVLDSDIWLNNSLKSSVKEVENDVIYSCYRYIVEDIYDLNNFDAKKFKKEEYLGIGFFQLFKTKKFYSIDFPSAGGSDLAFARLFKSMQMLDYDVIHLGKTGENWFGKKR